MSSSRSLLFLLVLVLAGPLAAADGTRLNVLFLGDNGPHQPPRRFSQLAPALETRGIDIRYTDDVAVLDAGTLDQFDAVVLYANIDQVDPARAEALVQWVESGGGFVPLHCASFCFRNSEAFVRLVGGQFQRHGTGVFGTEIVRPDHPIMQGFGGFRSWDETYIHTLLTEDRLVLEQRREGEQAEGREAEPWTWVREQGQGRVFYTAWGHDERTWSEPGFVNLVERGIRWAARADLAPVADYQERPAFEPLAMTELPEEEPFTYQDVGAKIPNYRPGAQWGTQDAPKSLMQNPLPAEESMKRVVTPVGFDLSLFVDEQKLRAKPIAMNWDEAGRLWVCETVDYPNELHPPGEGRDVIEVCEDTDGDGKADRITLFADRLSIPTAITCWKGGAIVQASDQTLYLKDTDGDGRADVREVLIDGWNVQDTHGGVSNFRFGLDNWIWAMQGYNDSRPEIDGQPQQRFRMGFFRFRLDDSMPPRVEELEFIRSTDNNTWGLGISEEGLIFGSTANHNPSVFMPVANRYYERVRGWGPEQLHTIADTYLFNPVTEKVRQVDHHGGYTAGAGHAIYTARRYPQQFWNRTAFVCGPTGHLVGTFVLEPTGAGYRSYSPMNLVASDDEWFAPIMAEVGPDGNVWIIDWYNYIVQHNPTPEGFETGKGRAYETELRDKKHGRVYRVVYGDDMSNENPDLSAADAATLVATLKNDNMFWRLQAQRQIIERGDTSVVPQLFELVRNPQTDAIGLNPAAIHALWTLDGLGALEDPQSEAFAVAGEALSHPSAGVRRAALGVLPSHPQSTAAILASNVLVDVDPQTRLAALLALSDAPSEAAAAAALAQQLEQDVVINDAPLRDALTSAAAMHDEPFLIAALQSDQQATEAAAGLLARVAEHYARQRPQQIGQLLAALTGAPATRQDAILSGLEAGWSPEHQIEIDEATESQLAQLARSLSTGSLTRLIRLSQRLGTDSLSGYVDQVAEGLIATLEDWDASDAERLAAAESLVVLAPASPEMVQALLDQVQPQASLELASGVLTALRQSQAEDAGQQIIELIPEMTPAVREEAIRVLLSRPAWSRELLAGIEQNAVSAQDLALDQRQALTSHPDRAIAEKAEEVFASLGGTVSTDREAVVQQMMVTTKQKGDVERGRAVFKEHCAKCHRHGEMGFTIGPDLTGMAVHPKVELLVNILDPSRSVEGNYRTYTVMTVDGIVINGMLRGESKTSIELVDTAAKEHTVLREDIERLVSSQKSVMPEGFEGQINEQQMTDLLEFMTDRGPYLPLDLSRSATASSDQPLFYGNDVEKLIFEQWGRQIFNGVPFQVIDPNEGRNANVILLHGPLGALPPKMPRSVTVPVGGPVKKFHLLSGIGGWNAQSPDPEGPVVMTVRMHFADGTTKDYPLRDGVHFADFIGPFDVPGSERAFELGGRQVRYLTIDPETDAPIDHLELIKERHHSAPLVVAITAETGEVSTKE